MQETTTIIIENTQPRMLSPTHMARIINYCVDFLDHSAAWLDPGSEMALLFRNGEATALDACNYYIDALNDLGEEGDIAFYSLNRNNDLVVTRPDGHMNQTATEGDK